ncbi:MAG: PHP domain-containing protein, partial [Patescibacteria group bacterium]
MSNYVNFHKHTQFSNIVSPDSAATNEQYLNRILELGQKVFSSNEHGYQGNYIQVYDLAKKNNLKFLFCVEAYFVKNRLEKDSTNAHIIVAAKNENGRRAINDALSEAWISGYYYKPRLDYELIFGLPGKDIFFTTACIGGVWKYDGDSDEIVLKLKEHFGNNFYLEVQNHDTESQKRINAKIINLSNREGIPLIFGADSHFIYPNQAKERDNFLLSRKVSYAEENGWYMDFPSIDTARERFVEQGVLTNPQIKEAIENTNILEDVEEYDSPIFNYDIKMPTIYPDKSQKERDKIFEELVWEKWEQKKPSIPQEKISLYESEIKKEVATVIDTFHSDYFLLNYEIIKEGRKIGGVLTQSGRGSGVSFYINNLLGFTEVDRIYASKDVVMFPERFMSKTRILESKSLADIDFNCGNPEVFAQAQKNILGENSSFPMVAFGTLGNKAAWKMFSRAKNVAFDISNEVSEQIEKYETKLKHTEDEEKDLVDPRSFISDEYYELYEQSKSYLGTISDIKVAPCGYVLYPGNIREEIGLIKIKSANGKEHICAVLDGHVAEDHKFLKNDLLKVSVVEMIDAVYKRIGIPIHTANDLLKICEDNEKVWDIYTSGFTVGINQIEQNSTTGKATKYKPRNIASLSALIAAVRPGFASMYKKFESREPFEYGLPSFDKLIQTSAMTDSFILYQEQLMATLNFSGMELSECYDAIKNISKKRVEKVKKLKDRFIKGFSKKIIELDGKSKDEADDLSHMVWQIISDASLYGFNSSHSYCMAVDSLYGAYLKSHYPLEFYEVILNMLEQDGDKDRLNRAKDEATRAFGITFPPYKFGQDNTKIVALPETNQITSSLASVKGFPSSLSTRLLDASKVDHKDFVEFLIYCEENGVISKKFEDLIRIDYFSPFGHNKKLILFYKEFSSGKLRYS